MKTELRKCTATEGGVIHLAYYNAAISMCMQYVGVSQESINKEATCKRCLKKFNSGKLPPNIQIHHGKKNNE